MPYRDKGNKPGPKTPFDPSLGIGENIGRNFPGKIHKLLSEWDTQRLLNRMAMEPDFKAKIIAQVAEPISEEKQKPAN